MVLCTRSSQDQAIQNTIIDKGDGYKFPHISEELLVVNGLCERESQFSFKLVGLTSLNWKAAHSSVHGQQKFYLMGFKTIEDTNLDGSGKRLGDG